MSITSEKIKSEFDDFDLILSPAMGGIIVDMKLANYLIKKQFLQRE